ncbi:hypothetical protein IAU60_003469 [Kwoniella sp. DSM 27419]
MSSKARSAVALGSVWRRAVASYGLTIPIGQGRPISAPDPDQPGCSRWFSSTPIPSTLDRRTYFSANPQVPVDEIESSQEGEDLPGRPDISTPHITRTPHLPLPPSLPYSPTSHPFRRHLEILSLSLYSTANESWSVYLALHPSLRRYIPDDMFRALLSQQADHPEIPQAWNRVKALLRLAKKCGMELTAIGPDTIAKCLRLGMRRGRTEKDKAKTQDTDKLVRRLWRAMEDLVLDASQIPHEIRRAWLGLQHRRLQHARSQSKDPRVGIPMEEAVLKLVSHGGATDLGHYVAEVLSNARERSVDGLRQSLRLMTYCITQGVHIGTSHLLRIMRRLSHTWTNEGEDGMEMVRKEIPLMMDELDIQPISPIAQQLYNAVDIAADRSRTRVQKAIDLLDADRMEVGEMIGRGISLSLSSKQTGSEEAHNAALRLLESATKHEGTSCEPLISALTITLYKAKRSSALPSIDALITRFVRLVHEARLFSRLPSEAVIPLLRLVLTADPSTKSYILSRKLYQHARATSPPFRWSQHNLFLWRRLFKSSLTPPYLHLHFASRLYTDLLADGVPVRRTDSLLMIRSIGLKSSPSRPILLERHIKDYLWMKHGSPDTLALALVQGLTQAGAKDADLALSLAQRLAGDQPLQPLVSRLIITQLAKSSEARDRTRCFRLLRQMDVGPEAVWSYNTVLSYLTHNARAVPEPGTKQIGRSQALQEAVTLYRELIARRLRPNARTVSSMVRVLLENHYLESAVAIFYASVRQRLVLKSSVVGRMMVHLAVVGRADEADAIETAWRGIADMPQGRIWDKGVIGARILVDLKKGKAVDVDKIRARTGWVGTAAFMRYLDQLKPPSQAGQFGLRGKSNVLLSTSSDSGYSAAERVQAEGEDEAGRRASFTSSIGSHGQAKLCADRWDMAVSF